MSILAAVADDPRLWLPWLALALLLLVLAFGLLAWVFLKRRKAAPPVEDQADDEDETTERWANAHMRRDVKRSLSTLSQLSDNGGNPYSVPWIFALGAHGADTRALIQAVDTSPGRAGGGIIPRVGSAHFCRQGAVFHAGDTLLDSASGLGKWRRLVRMMAACRPHRPVDGLVLALPAHMLIGPDAMPFDRLADRGSRFCEMIAAAQRLTGLRVPVTVVITGCEHLQGFGALVSALPQDARNAALGWSMPYSLETAYQAQWAEQATESIASTLSGTAIQLMMCGAPVNDPDGLLLLPSEVRQLAPRLKPLLAAIFQPSAYYEAFLFRGLFLTGQTPGDANGRAFASGLFDGKVFREYQLVRPVRGLLTARTRKLRTTQLVLAATLALELLGLSWLSYDIPRRVDALDGVLATISSDLENRIEAEGRLSSDAAQGAATRLLQELSRLDVVTLTSPLSPVSYFHKPDRQIEVAIAAGYDNIIIDEIRDRLSHRLNEILAAPPAGADTSGGLERLVDHLNEFDRIHRLYNDLPNLRSGAALATVVRYALGIELPAGFDDNAGLYQQAMGFSPIPALDQTQDTVGRQLRTHFAAAFRSRFDEGRLRRRFERIAQLQQAGEPQDPDEAMERLQELRSELQAVAIDLDSRDYGWINGEGHEIGPAFDALLGRLDGMGLVADGDISAIRQAGEQRIVEARRQLFESLSAEKMPQLRLEGGKAVLAPALLALKKNLDGLMERSFMSGSQSSQPDMRSGERPITWDVQWLKQAHRLVDDYLAFTAGDVMKFPSGLAFAVEMAAFDQARQQTGAALSTAAQPAERNLSGPYEMESEIKALTAAAQTLANLSDRLRLGRMDNLHTQLSNTIQTQGNRLLSAVDGLAAGLLMSGQPPEFDWWDGSMPMAARTYHAASLPELTLQMEADREALKRLVQEFADPLIRAMDGIAGEGGRRAMAVKWQSLARSVARYEQKDRESSLRRLEQFILTEMDRIDPSSCAALAGAPPTAGGDLFAVHLDQLKANLAKRCAALGANRVREQYAQVQTLFNETLAGRFPFARDAGPATPRAEPLAVRRFFWTLAQTPLPARPVIEAAAGHASGAFAAELSAVEKSLAPMLVDPTLDQPLAYEVEAEFRTNAVRDQGGNQIIEWGLETGGGQPVLSSRDAKRTVVWSAGQPVRLWVRFARNAPSLPAPDPQGRYRVDGPVATWETSDLWALLSLMAELSPDSATMLELPDRRAHTLALSLDLQRNPDAASGAPQSASARVYLRLGLTALIRKAGKPDEKVPVTLPAFPPSAPTVDVKSRP